MSNSSEVSSRAVRLQRKAAVSDSGYNFRRRRSPPGVSFFMSTSIRNRLPGTIEKIVSDKVVSELVVQTAAGKVTSIITTGSVNRMNLKEGDNVFAVIKATEVSVEKE
jgi:molybdopterin-binding protein